ncbi:hypothetical protein MTES_0234 [Microbacterium testaceum StLB037]|uniref:Uncharacterized protein n=1 Tax=Microbacterium testaceum (strain StLB037) TaxID=979556 RepID=E8N8Y9_MICTS|nr:hypothetical protein MTES_0234 [Microbacterium testaceum StLB037]
MTPQGGRKGDQNHGFDAFQGVKSASAQLRDRGKSTFSSHPVRLADKGDIKWTSIGTREYVPREALVGFIKETPIAATVAATHAERPKARLCPRSARLGLEAPGERYRETPASAGSIEGIVDAERTPHWYPADG